MRPPVPGGVPPPGVRASSALSVCAPYILAKQGHEAVVLLLLEQGAEVSAKDNGQRWCNANATSHIVMSVLTASERRGRTFKGCKDFYLKAKTRIWP